MRSKAYYILEGIFNQRQMEGRDAETVVRFMMVELRRGTYSGASGDHLPSASEGESPDHGLRGDGKDSDAKDASGEA